MSFLVAISDGLSSNVLLSRMSALFPILNLNLQWGFKIGLKENLKNLTLTDFTDRTNLALTDFTDRTLDPGNIKTEL